MVSNYVTHYDSINLPRQLHFHDSRWCVVHIDMKTILLSRFHILLLHCDYGMLSRPLSHLYPTIIPPRSQIIDWSQPQVIDNSLFTKYYQNPVRYQQDYCLSSLQCMSSIKYCIHITWIAILKIMCFVRIRFMNNRTFTPQRFHKQWAWSNSHLPVVILFQFSQPTDLTLPPILLQTNKSSAIWKCTQATDLIKFSFVLLHNISKSQGHWPLHMYSRDCHVRLQIT